MLETVESFGALSVSPKDPSHKATWNNVLDSLFDQNAGILRAYKKPNGSNKHSDLRKKVVELLGLINGKYARERLTGRTERTNIEVKAFNLSQVWSKTSSRATAQAEANKSKKAKAEALQVGLERRENRMGLVPSVGQPGSGPPRKMSDGTDSTVVDCTTDDDVSCLISSVCLYVHFLLTYIYALYVYLPILSCLM